MFLAVFSGYPPQVTEGVLRKAGGDVVCARCELADTSFRRMRGLLGRGSLEPGQGMLFRPAGSVHTFFMRFSIDVVFCDRDLRVLKVARELAPWRTAGARGAKIVVELAAAGAAAVEPGDQLVLEISPG
jgi:uncharacterized protein